MPQQGPIPERTLSKSPLYYEDFTEADETTKAVLEFQIRKVQIKLKPKSSPNAEYYAHCRKYTELNIKRVKLQQKQSKHDFARENGQYAYEEDWKASEQAIKLAEQEQTFKIDERIFKIEAEKRDTTQAEEGKGERRLFKQLYISSRKSLDTDEQRAGAGTKPSKIQSEFQRKVLAACGEKHPDAAHPDIWCPILAGWVHRNHTHVFHIFPTNQGQTSMNNIFNSSDTELNEIENGLIMSTFAAKMISHGTIVIVPDVPEQATMTERDEWTQGYKIRILDWQHGDMNTYVPATREKKRLWRDMDGEKVIFCSKHRPRARY